MSEQDYDKKGWKALRAIGNYFHKVAKIYKNNGNWEQVEQSLYYVRGEIGNIIELCEKFDEILDKKKKK
jgi:hypothetical protein